MTTGSGMVSNMFIIAPFPTVPSWDSPPVAMATHLLHGAYFLAVILLGPTEDEGAELWADTLEPHKINKIYYYLIFYMFML